MSFQLVINAAPAVIHLSDELHALKSAIWEALEPASRTEEFRRNYDTEEIDECVLGDRCSRIWISVHDEKQVSFIVRYVKPEAEKFNDAAACMEINSKIQYLVCADSDASFQLTSKMRRLPMDTHPDFAHMTDQIVRGIKSFQAFDPEEAQADRKHRTEPEIEETPVSVEA
jgi:hypothetical protein